MDRFKFRVWDDYRKGYMVGLDLFDEIRPAVNIGGDFVYFEGGEGLIIEQCTGLKDKNGQLIYEGDVVKNAYSQGEVVFGKHDFECGYPQAGCRTIGFGVKCEYDEVEELCKFMEWEWEIIGNIHDNPAGMQEEGK